jgi:hypothetical protein
MGYTTRSSSVSEVDSCSAPAIFSIPIWGTQFFQFIASEHSSPHTIL